MTLGHRALSRRKALTHPVGRVLSAAQGNALMGPGDEGLGILGAMMVPVDSGRKTCGLEGRGQRGCLYWVPESFALSSANGPG